MGRPSAFTMERRQRERESRRTWEQLTDSEKDTRIAHQCWLWDNKARALKALEPHITSLRDGNSREATLRDVYGVGCDDGSVRIYLVGSKRYPMCTHLAFEALRDKLRAEGYAILHEFTSTRRSRPGGVLHFTKYLTQLVVESPLPVFCKECKTPIAMHQPGTIYCGPCANRLNGIPE